MLLSHFHCNTNHTCAYCAYLENKDYIQTITVCLCLTRREYYLSYVRGLYSVRHEVHETCCPTRLNLVSSGAIWLTRVVLMSSDTTDNQLTFSTEKKSRMLQPSHEELLVNTLQTDNSKHLLTSSSWLESSLDQTLSAVTWIFCLFLANTMKIL